MAQRIIYRAVKRDIRQVQATALEIISNSRHLATGFASNERLSNVKYEVDLGAHSRAPHEKGVCEDACFFWDRYNIAAFGVADGVSGWRHKGVDASLFPNTLMANCMKHLEKRQGKIHPTELLNISYQDIMQNNEVEAGSSTVCLGILDKESGLLQTANLGDSGFCIFRNGEIFFKSKEQYIDWNFPAQIGVKEIVDDKSIPHGSSPSDAVVSHFDVQDKDFLILGTDGLFDNLREKDIFYLIQQDLSKGTDLNGCSKMLTDTALVRSVETKPDRITPREERMLKHDNDLFEIPGGNYDDVTVIIVHIKAQ